MRLTTTQQRHLIPLNSAVGKLKLSPPNPLTSPLEGLPSLPFSLTFESRFRHTYIVGKTGTGKSTLLQRMICNDIQRDRGVAVLDPHGSLIESIIQHCPKERIDDIILVDVTDLEF